MAAHTCQELKLSLEYSSHPSPCLDSLKVLALGGIGRVFWKLEEELWSGRVSSTEWKRWGVIYRSPSKTSRCCQLMYLSELLTQIGTSDQFNFKQPREVYWKLHKISEGGVETSDPPIFHLVEDPLSDGARHFRWRSELPTPTVFFRFSAKLCIVLRVCLLASNLDTIASPDRSFASLLIVWCFLYSNSK